MQTGTKQTNIGKPAASEYNEYYHKYVSLVEDADLLCAMEDQIRDTRELFAGFPEERGSHAYADGKWTIKEVITHLLDEDVFVYFRECARVLRRGGVAVFSFLDFAHPRHRANFLVLVREREIRHDVLKCFEKDTLAFFADATGFDVIEVIDAYDRVPAKFEGEVLPDGTRAGPNLIMGQSLLFLRRR